jgi:hypothetical protein
MGKCGKVSQEDQGSSHLRPRQLRSCSIIESEFGAMANITLCCEQMQPTAGRASFHRVYTTRNRPRGIRFNCYQQLSKDSGGRARGQNVHGTHAGTRADTAWGCNMRVPATCLYLLQQACWLAVQGEWMRASVQQTMQYRKNGPALLRGYWLGWAEAVVLALHCYWSQERRVSLFVFFSIDTARLSEPLRPQLPSPLAELPQMSVPSRASVDEDKLLCVNQL